MTRTSQRAQDVAVVLFCLLAIASCIGSPYPRDQILQHTPTALFVLVMLATRTRLRLSTPAFVGVLTFMTLHVLGARYIYSYVPYDDWSRELFGTSVSAQFGFTRNHYDRLVHFSFGLCIAYPVLEIMRRARMASEPWTYYFAVECILAAAVLYELGEWLVAVTFAPDFADRYLGQQGDMWDAQKDMGLALIGAVLTIGLTATVEHTRPARETRP